MPVDTSGTTLCIVPGVRKKTGVELNAPMRGFLARMVVGTGQTLVVTSGIRSTAAQASAMLSKVQRFGEGNLIELYNDTLAREVIEGGTDSAAAIQATLERQKSRGVFMSRHMRGDALDFRTRGLTAAERARIIEVAQELGAQTLDEGDHIHVEELGVRFAAFDPLVWGGVILAGGGLWWLAGD